MTDLSLATRPDTDAGPAPAGVPSRGRDVFVPANTRRPGAIAGLRRRLHWPLGIYTTPLAVLVLWQILSDTGVLAQTYAPSPTSIVRTAADAMIPTPGQVAGGCGASLSWVLRSKSLASWRSCN